MDTALPAVREPIVNAGVPGVEPYTTTPAFTVTVALSGRTWFQPAATACVRRLKLATLDEMT